MFSILNQLSVRNRIWAIVALLIASIVVGSIIDILMLRQTLWQEKELKTRHLVESGLSVLTHFRALQEAGELSEAAAQAAAIRTIKAMRYDGKEYFWLNDLGRPFPKMLMHPTIPALDGQVLGAEQYNCATRLRVGIEGDFKATDGPKNLFAAFVDVVNQGGRGYVIYNWPKPKDGGGTTDKRYPKLSYVEKFAPWGWVIGSGIYIDDVDTAVNAQSWRHLLLVAAVCGVLLLLASAMARSITQPLRQTVTTMRRIGQDDGSLRLRLPVEGNSEIAELARGFNDMLEHLEARDAELARHRHGLEEEVARRTVELQNTNERLAAEQKATETLLKKMEAAQNQLLQSEKMAAVGQLAAGVAHEINNPIGFVKSNLGTLTEYVESLLKLIDTYEHCAQESDIQPAQINAMRQAIDLDFLRQDVVSLLRESHEGLERVKKIVQDLKSFSHVDQAEWLEADLNAGLESALNVAQNQLKNKADIVRQYGSPPLVNCLPGQLNQVFMNLLVNAAQAIDQYGTITVRTGHEDDWVWVEIADTGSGMTLDVQNRAFEAFFTTKAVGKGTGLGLSLSYDIVVKKHGGRFDLDSTPGQGTAFRIWLPIKGGPQDEQAT